MGSVVISVDAELGWGFHDLEPLPTRRIEGARDGWRRLLDLLDRYEVPATWAVVGHLFLEDCDGKHRGHPAPAGWFDRERDEWRARPDLRFGRDLVEALLDADVDHDVGSHSFSHVVFTDDRVTRPVVDAELAASIDVARSHDVSLDSFVFPRNAIAHRDVLAEYGFRTYRGVAPNDHTGRLRPVWKLADAVFPDRVPLVEPTVDEYGLVNVPASLFLFRMQGVARAAFATVAEDPVVRQAKRGIDRASYESGVFHMWLHPNNLLDERDVARIRAILEHVRRRADETSLVVETMRDVGQRLPGESVSTSV